MNNPDAIRTELEKLHTLAEQLIEPLHRIHVENQSLRHSQEQLAGERARLIARNELARTRVEAMIQRLKVLEHPKSSS